jgi:hypothetical protein
MTGYLQLAVTIDRGATVRNARGGGRRDPARAVLEMAGAESGPPPGA